MFLFFKWVAKFENPKLKLLDAIDTSSDKVGLVKKVLFKQRYGVRVFKKSLLNKKYLF